MAIPRRSKSTAQLTLVKSDKTDNGERVVKDPISVDEVTARQKRRLPTLAPKVSRLEPSQIPTPTPSTSPANVPDVLKTITIAGIVGGLVLRADVTAKLLSYFTALVRDVAHMADGK